MDKFIAEHLRGVSRTYAILVPMLPEPLADAVGLAYLVFRIIDTVEDAPDLNDDRRRALLATVELALVGDAGAAHELSSPLGETPDEQALMRDAGRVFEMMRSLPPEYREALANSARTMIVGVRRLIERSAARGLAYPAVTNQDELREYCYYVAGTVGEMLCAMFAAHLHLPALASAKGLAVELGIGLQLVNILKDFRVDAAHGRRYLPIESDHPSTSSIYRAGLAAAQASLWRGVEFVLALPLSALGVRRFCGLPIAWGALTLAAARDAAGKMTRGVLHESIQAFDERVGDDEALSRWLGELLTGLNGGQPANGHGGRLA